MKARDILIEAASLVAGDRSETHGPAKQNHDNIAVLWNAYLAIRREPATPLNVQDVAHMMALFKISRTQLGANNMDDWVDAVGYLAIAGELSND